MIRKKTKKDHIVIDLTGLNGNAFALIAYANKWAKDMGYSPSDIEHLVEVFDNHFGNYVILER